MKRILTIALLFVGQVAFGQSKNIQVPVYRQKDTTLWYIWTKEDIQKIGLLDLTTTTQPLHFRFWTERQAIDIWTTDNKTFDGNLINYTTEYDPDKYKTNTPKPEKFYSRVDRIDTVTARQIYEFAINKRVFEVPFQDSIKGWSQGVDGATYFIEYSTFTEYSFKDYWTPQYQIKKGIKEAAIIETVLNYLNKTLNTNKAWKEFIDSLPKGCYHAGSLFLTCNNTRSKKKNRG